MYILYSLAEKQTNLVEDATKRPKVALMNGSSTGCFLDATIKFFKQKTSKPVENKI